MDEKIEFENEIAENEAIEAEAVEAEAPEADTVEEKAEEAEAPEDDFLYGGQADETKSDSYDCAVRAVVFGAVSVTLPVLGLILYAFGGYLMAALAAGLGLVLAILGFMGANKCKALKGTYEAALAKNGRLISMIGLLVAAAVLAYVLISIIITVLAVAAMIGLYVIVFVISVLSAILPNIAV